MKTPVSDKAAATVSSARVMNEMKRFGLRPETVSGANVIKGNFRAPGRAAEDQPPDQPPPTASAPQPTTVGRFQVTPLP